MVGTRPDRPGGHDGSGEEEEEDHLLGACVTSEIASMVS